MIDYEFTAYFCVGKCGFGDTTIKFEVTEKEYSILLRHKGEELSEVKSLAKLSKRVYDYFYAEFASEESYDSEDELSDEDTEDASDYCRVSIEI